jgi:NADH:ubiquinone oxidoreductase subunit H
LWELNTALWSAKPAEWIVALLAVIAAAIVVVFLQRQQIQELQPRSSPSSADAHAAGLVS